MSKTWMIWLLLVFVLYVFGLFLIAWVSLHPFRTPVYLSPGGLGKPQEDLEFQSSDEIFLKGWWIESPGSKLVAVLSHGYMMNRCELTPLAVWLFDRGYSVLVYDFRAHGKSSGRKCGLGWTEREDVVAAVRQANRLAPGARLLLVGSSMGASASVFALSEDPSIADALILDSAYSRMPQAIYGWWRFIGGRWLSYLLSPCVLIAAPLAGFNPFKIDVANALREIDKPILFVHGDCDTLAIPEEARRNELACAGPTEVAWMPGCGHCEGRWVHPELFYLAIERFLSVSMKGSRSSGCPKGSQGSESCEVSKEGTI